MAEFLFFMAPSVAMILPTEQNRKLVTNSSPKQAYLWAISVLAKPEKQDRQRDLASVPHN